MSLYETRREYSRIVEVMEVTDKGVRKQGEAPDDAEISLEVEVVHAITVVDEGGTHFTQWFDQPEPEDKDGNTGGGYELDGTNLVDHEWFPNQVGPSTVRSILATRLSTRLPSFTQTAAAKVQEIKDDDATP